MVYPDQEKPHYDQTHVCLETRMIAMPGFLKIVLLTLSVALTQNALARPIKIAIDAEFGIPGSTSAQAVFNGAQVAVNEINVAGGVLGRKLEIVQRDNRGIPARAINNLRELAADPDVVAILCGKYSPVVVDMLPELHRLKMPLLDPWAAADPITMNDYSPSFVFRLSLRDTWAMQVMMQRAAQSGAHKIALLLPNSEWGRSNLRAAQRIAAKGGKHPRALAFEWYHWGDKSLLPQYKRLLASGAQALILVANEQEGVVLINQLAALPVDQRLPVLAHWGLTAGRFFELTEAALKQVDVSVVQTFTFIDNHDPVAQRVLAGLLQVTGNGDARKVVSPVGVAHAYDIVHLLARAIALAGNTDRTAIRHSLERLGPYQGVTRKFARPFTPQRHDALSVENVFMARFAADGAVEPLPMFTPKSRR